MNEGVILLQNMLDEDVRLDKFLTEHLEGAVELLGLPHWGSQVLDAR